MLSLMSGVSGSAEKQGTLDGGQGSFCLPIAAP